MRLKKAYKELCGCSDEGQKEFSFDEIAEILERTEGIPREITLTALEEIKQSTQADAKGDNNQRPMKP